MKTVFLFFILFFGFKTYAGLFPQGAISGHPESYFCFISYNKNGSDLKCAHTSDDGKTTYAPIPKLVNPRFVQVGFGEMGACAIDDIGLHCWLFISEYDNKLGYEILPIPQLKNPKLIALTGMDHYYHFCALDEDKVKCWYVDDADKQGHRALVEAVTPPLGKVTKLQVMMNACASDEQGLHCWWQGAKNSEELEEAKALIEMPVLNHPYFFSMWTYNCALDEDGGKCWKGPEHEFTMQTPKVSNPYYIKSGNYYLPDEKFTQGFVCMIGDEGIGCSYKKGDPVFFTQYKNPQIIFDHDCIIDDDGFSKGCKINEKLDMASIYLSDVSSYLEELHRLLTTPRAQYLSQINEYLSKLTKQNDGNRYLSLALVSPAILTMDSEAFVKRLIPQLNRDLNSIHGFLGYKNLNDGLSKQVDSVLNRQIALKSIQAAVTVALEFVSNEQKIELQTLLRQIGQVYSNPSNTAQIKDLIVKLESPASPLQKLTSPKSAFLIDVINLAKDWLKKVK